MRRIVAAAAVAVLLSCSGCSMGDLLFNAFGAKHSSASTRSEQRSMFDAEVEQWRGYDTGS